MDQRSQRTWVNLSFFVAAAIFGILASTLATRLSVSFDLEAKVSALQWWLRGVGFFVGGSVFFGLLRNKTASQFMGEVVAELASVVWPSQEEVTRSTSIVILMVIVSGLILGLLDYLCGKLIQLFL
jgi:preprotein translocase SecE subunit